MATRADIDSEITLELEGKTLPAEKFLKAATAFVHLVQDLTSKEAGDEKTPKWVVQVKSGSNLIGLNPAPGYNPAIIHRVARQAQDLIDRAEKNDRTITALPETTLRNLRALATVAEENGDGVSLRVWIKKEPISMGVRTAANLKEWLEVEYKDYGSVEGRLQVISERGNFSAEITDPLHGKAIKCILDTDKIKAALDLFGQRVEAYGLIRYRKDGNIADITVDEFVPFPSPTDIPSFEDVRGILGET